MKPVIFVSHIHEQSAIAASLKETISGLLLNGVEFFVSSDRGDVVGGDRWLNRIEDRLRNASIVLVLCDAISVMRPWVNFEAGGGWFAGKRVVPLCCVGYAVSSLPQPLASLQAYSLGKAADLRELVRLIAEAAELTCPSFDADALQEKLQNPNQRFSADAVDARMRLSNDAAVLLEAAIAGDNHILCGGTCDGYFVTTNDRSFVTDASPRTEAHWRGVIDELVKSGLIAPRNSVGSVYAATKLAFDTLDPQLEVHLKKAMLRSP